MLQTRPALTEKSGSESSNYSPSLTGVSTSATNLHVNNNINFINKMYAILQATICLNSSASDLFAFYVSANLLAIFAAQPIAVHVHWFISLAGAIFGSLICLERCQFSGCSFSIVFNVACFPWTTRSV